MKQILVIGGGFAGVRATRKLTRSKDVYVTLINDRHDFRYSPALYRAASGFKLGTARIPLEWMLLDRSNISLVIGRAKTFEKENKIVKLEDGRVYKYDYVVFALGSVTSYFNINGLEKHCLGVKSTDEILKLKSHLSDNFSKDKKVERNYVIAGAGPTGVELAGTLGVYLKKLCKKHRTSASNIKIYLVEAGERIAPQLEPRAGRLIANRLKKLGVKIMLNTQVKAETIGTLKTSDGEIKTHTVIWTAGTMNNPFFENNKQYFKLDKRGRVVVDDNLRSSSSEYVCGDNCSGQYCGLAFTAVRHGNFVAQDILARVNKTARPKYKARRPVQIVPIGSNWAILQYGKLVLSGRLPGLLRRGADFIGYSDVMGAFKALTIWTQTEDQES